MKTERSLIDGLADAYAAKARAEFLEMEESELKKAESPIERVLTMAWLANPIDEIYWIIDSSPLNAECLVDWYWEGRSGWIGSIHPQAVIGNYRVDMYLQAFFINCSGSPRIPRVGERWIQLAIECDGHDFHERTKEQARRDKKRDRWFQTNGISVMRFTGSEIWEDPLGCIAQIDDAFFAAWRRYRSR